MVGFVLAKSCFLQRDEETEMSTSLPSGQTAKIMMELLGRVSGFQSLHFMAWARTLAKQATGTNGYLQMLTRQNIVPALGSNIGNSSIQFIFTNRSGQERYRNL